MIFVWLQHELHILTHTFKKVFKCVQWAEGGAVQQPPPNVSCIFSSLSCRRLYFSVFVKEKQPSHNKNQWRWNDVFWHIKTKINLTFCSHLHHQCCNLGKWRHKGVVLLYLWEVKCGNDLMTTSSSLSGLNWRICLSPVCLICFKSTCRES